MTRKPAPGHGTRACYLRGCRRPECSQANYRYMSRVRLDYAHGNRRRTTPDKAAAHVQELLNHGWTQAQIARATGVNHRVIGSLHDGLYPTINRDTERRILAAPVTEPPNDARDTDATGTIRRIRALIAIGHPGAHIASEVGLHRDALNRIARGELSAVRVTTAEAVASAYKRLSRTPGSSGHARAMATRRGWHGPLAWDGNIDDPQAQPETSEAADAELKRGELAALRRHEIQHLAAFDLPEHEIADRLGMSRNYVHDLIRDMGKAA